MPKGRGIPLPERVGEPKEVNYGDPAPPDFGPLARDYIPIRSMRQDDLLALTAIDRRITGRERSQYFAHKLAEALRESDIRVSLVAELDEVPIGFIMARVDLGEFGRTDPVAIMDTIGVDPDYYHDRGVGRALLSQLLVNLATLRVERIMTEVDWANWELLTFLDRCGFKPAPRLSFDCALV